MLQESFQQKITTECDKCTQKYEGFIDQKQLRKYKKPQRTD